MSNIFGADADGSGSEATDAGADALLEATDAALEGETDTGTDTTETETAVDTEEADLSVLADLLSEAGIDSVWLDLDGDMVPETMIPTDGPFAVEGEYDDGTFTDWTTAEAFDFETSSGDYDGQSMSMLLPYDVEAGYPDPFVLPESDWCDCGVYDPMTAPTDWTTDGYADFNDVFALPGADGGFNDAGAYYEQFAPTTGYFDTTSYYDSADGYLDASTPVDYWDMQTAPGAGFDTGMGYDSTAAFDTGMGYDSTAAFDTGMGYDPAAYSTTSSYDPMSSWDPSAGDASHDAFIDTITGDYADPTTGVDLDTMSANSQYWMDEYNAADDLSWDAWNASVDAYIAGDTTLSYDLNQASIAADSYADTAWDYSNDAWSSSSYYSTSSTSVADDGWYDAMSLE